jgi:hypothetical protein
LSQNESTPKHFFKVKKHWVKDAWNYSSTPLLTYALLACISGTLFCFCKEGYTLRKDESIDLSVCDQY